MNERDDEQLSAEARRAQDAVRGLSQARPDAVFRARLRDAFVHGTIESPARRIVPLPWYRRGVVGWAAVPVAAAAALAVVLVLNQGPQWNLVSASGVGVAVVDGRPIPMNHTEDLAGAIHAGSRVDVPDGSEIRIAIPGRMVLLATPGTRFRVPAVPGRWFGRKISAGIERGTLRITTQAAFHGGRLSVRTPEADVMVYGSTLAVICEPTGTCVCVLEGHVRMGPHGEPMDAIEDGMRRYVFNDGRAPEHDSMRPTERQKLTMFREQAASKS